MNKITVITGRQMSGKTTLLNQMLSKVERGVQIINSPGVYMEVASLAANGCELIAIDEVTDETFKPVLAVCLAAYLICRLPYNERSTTFERPTLIIAGRDLTREMFTDVKNVEFLELKREDDEDAVVMQADFDDLKTKERRLRLPVYPLLNTWRITITRTQRA